MSDLAAPVGFFSDGSPYLAHPLLTAERTTIEIDEVERLVGSVSGRVLDVGCGFGRHSIELASRGADVTGIDPSSTMIAAARSKAVEANCFVDFVCLAAQDLREVARYDLAICLFTSFGQLGTNAQPAQDTSHVGLLRQTRQALRPGGQLVLELPDRDRVLDALVENEQLGPTAVARRFDARTSVLTERFTVATGGVYLLRYRLFDTTELADVVHDAGFEINHVQQHGLVQPPPTLTTLAATRPAS